MIHENDDLWYALEYNQPERFAPDDIVDIVAEVPGENDELNWWWILALKDGRFVLLSAWCDYTGWDCQSGIVAEEIHPSALACAKAAPEFEDRYFGDRSRQIRENLLRQLDGRNPLYTYIEP